MTATEWRPSRLSAFLLAHGVQADACAVSDVTRDEWFGLLHPDAAPTLAHLKLLRRLGGNLGLDWREMAKCLLEPELVFAVTERGEVWTPVTRGKLVGIPELLLLAAPHLSPEERIYRLQDLRMVFSPRMSRSVAETAQRLNKPLALYRQVQVQAARNMLAQDLRLLAVQARQRGTDVLSHYEATVQAEAALAPEQRIYSAPELTGGTS